MARPFDVAVMHDFFVDRIVQTRSIALLTASLTEKVRQGGGGIHGVTQQEIKGGNAVNLANALAMLGLRTLLITHSDPFHEKMLREPFRGLDVEVRMKPNPPGLTVALEGEVNIMLGHLGGAGNFGVDFLNEDDWKALRGAGVVCSVNWAANRKGTGLLTGLRAKLGNQKVIFFDPADFRDRAEGFAILLEKARKGKLADWISLNEYEATEAARLMGFPSANPRTACSYLANELHASIDVHTLDSSYSCEWGKGKTATTISEPTRKVVARRLTGAGDVWNAASIYGRIRRFSGRKRLRFANRAASLYVGAIEPTPPSVPEVLDALGY